MSGQVQLAILALHVLGVLIWVGSMGALTPIFTAHARAGAGVGEAFVRLERRMAVVMDIGAAISIGAGVGYLAATHYVALQQGWFHAKLTLVLLLLGAHGWVRVWVKRCRQGRAAPMPRVFHSLFGLVVLAIIALAVVKPF